MSATITRRDVLKSSVGILGLSVLGAYEAFANDKNRRFKIGACDWSIQKMSEVEAIRVGKNIGLDGVQIRRPRSRRRRPGGAGQRHRRPAR